MNLMAKIGNLHSTQPFADSQCCEDEQQEDDVT